MPLSLGEQTRDGQVFPYEYRASRKVAMVLIIS